MFNHGWSDQTQGRATEHKHSQGIIIDWVNYQEDLSKHNVAKNRGDRYCRLGNFREKFIFANSIKRHISDVKSSRLRQDLPISINDRVILPLRVGFIFPKKFRENKVLAKITEFTVPS